ncbi:MAG: DapH/DapD/GlmU-related protein [Planctomycetota bacterium]
MRREFRDWVCTLLWVPRLGACGPDVQIKRGTRIYRPGNVSIGPGSRLGRDVDIYAHPRGDVPADAITVQIGAGCHMGHRCNLAGIKSVVIEDKVVMGNDVYIADHGHEYRDPNVPVIDQPVTEAKPVRICEGSWLGAKAVILPGVTVGKHAVVGAGAIVTKDVEAFTVVAGNPAVVVKRYDSHSKIWAKG